MFDYKHPLGNYKISIVKFFAKIFSSISLFFLSFLFKIDKNKNEIIISSAFYAPWKDDKNFYHFYHKIRDCTLLDSKRLYTLWFLSKSLNGVCVKLAQDVLPMILSSSSKFFLLRSFLIFLIDLFKL